MTHDLKSVNSDHSGRNRRGTSTDERMGQSVLSRRADDWSLYKPLLKYIYSLKMRIT
jgi:hypothetical protein